MEVGIARLYAVGALSAAVADAFGEGGRKFDTHEALAEALRADIAAFLGTDFAAGASAASPSGGGEKLAAEAAPTGADAPTRLQVLVKGSRGSAMDRVVRALLDNGERSEEHTSELQSLMRSSYAAFCLKEQIQVITTRKQHPYK